MVIHEAAEMYLENILLLERESGSVRAVDVAKRMGYSKPTISEQMKKFRENGYIDINDGSIVLTEKGREVAERIYERHEVIAKLLIVLGVSSETAYADACRVEHDLSDETFLRLRAHYERYIKDIR